MKGLSFLPLCSIFGILFVQLAFCQPQSDSLSEFNHQTRIMGSAFEFTAVSNDDSLAWRAMLAAEKECRRIEALISSWNPNSQTSQINLMAGKEAVKVAPELFELIRRSKKISLLTNGAFDISFASIEKIWSFKQQELDSLPDSATVAKSVRMIDWTQIVLDDSNQSVKLNQKDMKIGFGAIGKGYAANQAKKIMQEMGIKHGLVNAGGDLITWGNQKGEEPWKIAIADPEDQQNAIGWLDISGLSVVTSGNYEKFFMHDGKRYAHIINPWTGYPVINIKSVTIICPNAEFADGLATAVFVLGEKSGLSLINELNGVEGLIINHLNEVVSSDGLILNYYHKE